MEQRMAAAGANPFDYVELPTGDLLSAAALSDAHRQAPLGVHQPGRGLLSPAVFGNAHRQASMGIRQPGTGLLSAGVSGYPKHGKPSQFGRNPLEGRLTAHNQRGLSAVVKCYEPHGRSSKERYDWITEYLAAVVEEAIRIRKGY